MRTSLSVLLATVLLCACGSTPPRQSAPCVEESTAPSAEAVDALFQKHGRKGFEVPQDGKSRRCALNTATGLWVCRIVDEPNCEIPPECKTRYEYVPALDRTVCITRRDEDGPKQSAEGVQ